MPDAPVASEANGKLSPNQRAGGDGRDKFVALEDFLRTRALGATRPREIRAVP